MREQKGNIEFLYASAILLKLYKAKIISRAVLEKAEKICKEKLAEK